MKHGETRLKVFGCGGCGINLAKAYEATPKGAGYADTTVSYIDTSHSNLVGVDGSQFHLITDEADGSGKVRRDNAAVISDNIRLALQEHTPATFNIVVFSASGGSGSVIGPLLLKELLERGVPAMAIVVGSSESSITATNSLNTIKSLAAIGQSLDKPMVMSYQHNSRDNKRSDVDAVCLATINTIAALCSEENDELDTSDVRNWLFYNHSTTVEAQLSLLEVTDDIEVAKKIEAPISVASLLIDKDTPAPELFPEYSCIGYREAGFEGDTSEVHYVISVAGIAEITRLRSEEVQSYEQQTASRVSTTRKVLADNEKVDATGLIL